jgi:hypothetical protein
MDIGKLRRRCRTLAQLMRSGVVPISAPSLICRTADRAGPPRLDRALKL